jgi:hypothetical protein
VNRPVPRIALTKCVRNATVTIHLELYTIMPGRLNYLMKPKILAAIDTIDGLSYCECHKSGKSGQFETWSPSLCAERCVQTFDLCLGRIASQLDTDSHWALVSLC